MSEAARRALQELEASILFAPDFPKRLTYTQPQLAALRQAKSVNVHGPALEAIERTGDQVEELRCLVKLLGKERYHQSVPALSRLWKECALQPVWVPVGHALFNIGTPEAMETLVPLIEDHDWFARHMAFKAVFARGSGAAFGSGYF
jgi:HEAT repeat protein